MRFPFRFAPSYRPVALALGITPRTAYVDVTADELVVHFGLWRWRTALGNVARDDPEAFAHAVRPSGNPSEG